MERGGNQRSPEAQAEYARRREEIRARFAETGDVDRVARDMDLNRRTVLRHTRDLRPTAPRQVRYSPEVWANIERFLREDQGSYAEASRTFGPNQKVIWERFPGLGWTREEAGRHQSQVNQLMRKLERASYASGN
jgi:transposase-like protein